MRMCWQCNPHVYLKMTKEGTISSCLAYSSIFFTKSGNEHNNERCKFTSIRMASALLLSVVYQHSPWIHKQFYRGKVVFPTWREGSQASRLTDAMSKGTFDIILFIPHRLFMLDKCFQKIKIHPMRLSGSNGICRITVMMAAFLATLYSLVKL